MTNETIDILIDKVLSKQANSSDQAEFEQWLNASESNKMYFEQSKIIWNKLNNTFTHLSFDKKLAQERIIERFNRNKYNKKTQKFKYWLVAAASVAILIGLFTLGNSNKMLLTYTATNQVEQIMLPDSSEVWLNKNSQLSVYKGFNKRKRKLALKGEAFFNVKRNIEKPFMVYTGKTVTSVLGTSFNLFEHPDNYTVITVNSGKVSFNKKRSLQQKTILHKNDKAIFFDNTNTIEKAENINLNYLSWKSNHLIFKDTPLSDVCQQLSKHFNTKIINSTNDSNLYMTGKYEGESLGEILQIIEITFSIRVDSSANEYSLYDARMN